MSTAPPEGRHTVFTDRAAAGRALARLLEAYRGRRDVLVLALPRGGVPVGHEVAQALGVEFDLLLVRRLAVPHQKDLTMGAIASGGALHLNDDVLRMTSVSKARLQAAFAEEREELRRQERLLRDTRPALDVRRRTVILVDEGLSTGSSMHAAVAVLRTLNPAAIVVAVPVAPADAAASLRGLADEFVCVHTLRNFRSVGQFYRDYPEVGDAEVRELLDRRRHPRSRSHDIAA
ncbi:MAG: phosphoribosyltransferase family protein [Nevskia sp.]|nr:phosphoribosyltransferase family protein [Nevskia sp.]